MTERGYIEDRVQKLEGEVAELKRQNVLRHEQEIFDRKDRTRDTSRLATRVYLLEEAAKKADGAGLSPLQRGPAPSGNTSEASRVPGRHGKPDKREVLPFVFDQLDDNLSAYSDITPWDHDCGGKAMEEGWALFECSGTSHLPIEVQKVDDDEILEDDTQAWELIATKSTVCHMGTLRFLRDHSPQEYGQIIGWCRAKREAGKL